VPRAAVLLEPAHRRPHFEWEAAIKAHGSYRSDRGCRVPATIEKISLRDQILTEGRNQEELSSWAESNRR